MTLDCKMIQSKLAAPNFLEVVSTMADNGHPHASMHLQLPSLLHHLVKWRIALMISNVHSLTAPHAPV